MYSDKNLKFLLCGLRFHLISLKDPSSSSNWLTPIMEQLKLQSIIGIILGKLHIST